MLAQSTLAGDTDLDPDLRDEDPTHRTGVSQLWMAPHHGRAEMARLGSQPQARVLRIMREDNLLRLRCRKFVVTH